MGKVKNNKVKLTVRMGRNSKYQTTMKALGQKNIMALCALLMAGMILTSAYAKSPETISEPAAVIEFEDDLSYMDEIEEYVDEYLESMMNVDTEEPNIIKVYDENGDLVLEENVLERELSDEATRLIRQSEFLTEYDDTTYYRLNS